MVQSTLLTSLTKPSKRRATWRSPFTDEQRAHFEKIAAQQKRIDDMATARELVQMFYARDKDGRNPWLREALNRIANKHSSSYAQKIRTYMTSVRINEYENDTSKQGTGSAVDAPSLGKNETSAR